MQIRIAIQKNAYHDSVALMSLTGQINGLDGIEEAVVSMGTPMNKELLANVGMLTEEAAACGDNDLILAVKAESEEALEQAFQEIDGLLHAQRGNKKKGGAPVQTWGAAVQALPEANLAIISVPGEYAAREAEKALKQGMHVMIFSDNVTLAEEKRVKELAAGKGLLVMGPDCGTAIINGVGLCFANEVRRGSVGLVAASGTGLQEVTVQLHRLGLGVSQAIGTGGRDLHEEIGGIMMLEGIRALQADEKTEVIVLISKPPHPSVQERMLRELEGSAKPAVVCFLDGDAEALREAGFTAATTLLDTAQLAAGHLKAEPAGGTGAGERFRKLLDEADRQRSRLAAGQTDVRGLFCGGTLTAEALSILRGEGLAVRSNVAKKPEEKLQDVSVSTGHTLLDLGDDEFTRGRPHPMIEPGLRNERIVQEGRDPAAAVLYLDFELGYGSHADPAGVSIEAIREARRAAEAEGRYLPVVAYVCGTELDKQDKASQTRLLEEAGVLVAESNKEAALLAARLAGRSIKEEA
ncbi:acyl-CoA synthetase FdrA [Paenibacillus tepidiphilus]|uniref:acyl-CoA synthetase FdrA n=1 Tax=Paenibacillus tepidiphilus TaxID=2608683 RepID=UPI00123C201C|nr:acyl-CoA synthetase FdrA [Paenibacillus tepidiphilus]